MYHTTVYALRENTTTVECERKVNKAVLCVMPGVGRERKEELVDLCFVHYRHVDYIQGAENYAANSSLH